ncbi:MAG: hypothetical protein P9M14_03255 [Candidatus Alcyoniella australis]|nr:hypothetical protein [Candidatus Alcyoniella australis]
MRKPLLLLSALLVVALCASVAHAKQVEVFPGEPWPLNEPLPLSQYSFFPDEREMFSISWFVLADLDDGGALFCNVMITNIGIGDQKATVDVTWIDPQGEDHFVRQEFDDKAFEASTERLDIKVGQSFLSGDYPNFRLRVAQQEMVVDVKLHAVVPGWQPNSSFVFFDGDKQKYYSARVPVPMAELTGTVTLEGKTHPISGRAYLDHAPVSMLPNQYSDRWQSLRSMSGEYTIDYLEFRLPKQYGAGLATWIIVAQGSQIVLATTAAALQPSDWVVDQATGLKKPMRVGFQAAANGWSISGEVRVKKLMEYIDILSKLSFIERTVAGLFAQSHVWRFRCDVTATLSAPDGTQIQISQPGISEVLYIGK